MESSIRGLSLKITGKIKILELGFLMTLISAKMKISYVSNKPGLSQVRSIAPNTVLSTLTIKKQIFRGLNKLCHQFTISLHLMNQDLCQVPHGINYKQALEKQF